MLKSLWVMRHGLAESRFESDFTRPLSLIGAEQASNVANQIKQDGVLQPLNMLVSPFARTQSTAEIVHSTLSMKQAFQTEGMLVHSADHRILGEYLMNVNFEYLILISHMPIVAYLCHYLCSNIKINGFETAQAVRLNFSLNQSENKMLVTHAKTYLVK
ncbi:MAG: phosphohistidine phosphatase [Polaribacter sp.]|jgi:phosphohistidine phosphatase